MLVPETKENLEKCICRTCPTFDECMKNNDEGLYCAKGKTGCTVEKKECLCVSCPIDAEYRLTGRLDLMEKMILKMNTFYCEAGPAGSKK
jgi:hypothetical protein